MAISGINPLALQGLATGMDTESIIAKITEAREIQLKSLRNKKAELEFRKETLRLFNTQILALQKSMFDLRLDTSFKTKAITSSNTDIITATVQSSASAGQHFVKVNQLAQAARATSNVFTPRLSASPANTAGLDGISGALTATPMYLIGEGCEGTTAGTIGSNIKAGSNNLTVTFNDTTVNLTLNNATANSTSLETVAADLELKLNDALNQAKGTSNVTYVVARVKDNTLPNQDQIYLISNFDGANYNISVHSTSTAAAALGLGTPANITTVAGTDPAGGEHKLTFTNATVGKLTSGAHTGNITIAAGDTLNLSINDKLTQDVALTVTQAGGNSGEYDLTNDTEMASLASNLQTDINNVFGSGTVTVSWDTASKKIVVTNSVAGSSNNITVNVDKTGTPSAALKLTSGTGAKTTEGTNAKVVDVFTPTYGAPITKTVEDTTMAGTASTMNGLLWAINGYPPPFQGGHTLDGGGPLLSGVTISATSGLTAGTAIINTASGNELNTTTASSAMYVSASDIATSTLTVTNSLSTAGFRTAPSTATNGTFTINGKQITISDYTSTTVNEIMAKINASGAGVTCTYDTTNDRFVLTANKPGADQTITLGEKTDTSDFLTMAGFKDPEAEFIAGADHGTVDATKPLSTASFSITPTSGIITINDIPIYINTSSDSLNDIINKINSSAAGVVASYNASTDTFSLVSAADDNSRDVITLGSALDTSNFFYATKLVYPPNIETDGTPTVLNIPTQLGQPGQRAMFQVDGVNYNRKSNTVTDVLTGVSMTLHSLQAPSSAPVALNITANTDQVLNMVKTFIVEYNKTVEMASPLPLTKEEREKQMPELTIEKMNTMSLIEIEEYNANREALRRKEALRQDRSVKTLHNELRRMLSAEVAGVDSHYNSLWQIGLRTGDIGTTWGTNLHGMILTTSTNESEIEEALKNNTTFMNLLESNPDEMAKLFTQLTDATVTAAGTVDASEVTLDTEAKVRIGNGTTYTELTLAAKTYTGSELALEFNNALSKAGLNELVFSLNAANKMQIVSTINTEDNPQGESIIDLADLQGNLFNSILGLTPGSYYGPTAYSLMGVARKMENLCKNYTQVGGVLQQKIKTAGDIDREIGYLSNHIDAFENRIEMEQQRLWKQFTNLESYMNRANQQSQWLQMRLAAMTNMNNNTSQ